jgi:hypothetical protein
MDRGQVGTALAVAAGVLNFVTGLGVFYLTDLAFFIIYTITGTTFAMGSFLLGVGLNEQFGEDLLADSRALASMVAFVLLAQPGNALALLNRSTLLGMLSILISALGTFCLGIYVGRRWNRGAISTWEDAST